jgi:hypothetical protein
MKATLKNYILRWWHCLTHLHREFSMCVSGKKNISCADCSYGDDNETIQGKESFRI